MLRCNVTESKSCFIFSCFVLFCFVCLPTLLFLIWHTAESAAVNTCFDLDSGENDARANHPF